MLADLEPRVLAPGHGRPLTAGTAAALHVLAQGSAPTRGGWLDRLLRPLGYTGEGRHRPPRLYSQLRSLGFALTRLGRRGERADIRCVAPSLVQCARSLTVS